MEFKDNEFEHAVAAEEQSELYECYVCLETFSSDQGEHMCEADEHFACYGCARAVIERSLDNIREFPASCCPSSPWPLRRIWNLAPTTVAEKYEERFEEYNCPNWLRVYCANPDCTRYRQSKYQEIKGDKEDRVVICLTCATITCLVCRKFWKEDHTCDKAGREEKAYRPPWVPIYTPCSRIKRCPNCLEWIEHEGGCNSMFCAHCNQHFCFVCLLKYDPPTNCDCPSEGDPEEWYDSEGYERTERAIHYDTGLNREGLNLKEILNQHSETPDEPPRLSDSESQILSNPDFSADSSIDVSSKPTDLLGTDQPLAEI